MSAHPEKDAWEEAFAVVGRAQRAVADGYNALDNESSASANVSAPSEPSSVDAFSAPGSAPDPVVEPPEVQGVPTETKRSKAPKPKKEPKPRPVREPRAKKVKDPKPRREVKSEAKPIPKGSTQESPVPDIEEPSSARVATPEHVVPPIPEDEKPPLPVRRFSSLSKSAKPPTGPKKAKAKAADDLELSGDKLNGKVIKRKRPKGKMARLEWEAENSVPMDGNNKKRTKRKLASSRWDTFNIPGVPKEEKQSKRDIKNAKKINVVQASRSFRQLARLLSVSRTEIDPLTRMAQQYKGTPMGTVYAKMRTDIAENNSSFSAAFSRHGKVFPRVVNGLVTVGAQAGKEPEALMMASAIIREQAKTGRRIRAAVSEPMFTFVLTILFLFVVLFGIIPQFEAVFAAIGKPLPLMSVILKYFSYFVAGALGLTAIGSVVWTIYWKKIGKYNEDLRVNLDIKLLKLPIRILSELLQTGLMSQLFSNMAILRGINMTERNSLVTAARSTTNWALRKSLLIHAGRLEAGEVTFGDFAWDSRIYPIDAAYMLKVGEDSGKGTQTLTEMAEEYKEEADLAADQFVAQVGPIVNSVVGVIYMFVMLASYLPIFSIYTAMGQV